MAIIMSLVQYKGRPKLQTIPQNLQYNFISSVPNPKIPNSVPISSFLMENSNKIEGDDGGLMLPEPIIQHIQSFMTGKEAAQTTILSKFWWSAWLTRPNLEFDQRDYRIYGFADRYGFHEYARKTMRRYQQLNLVINSLKLFINDFSVGKELIVKAMEMGAVDLHFDTQSSTFVLPHEVLESEKLVRLSVTACKIDSKATWPSLESLSLCGVCIEGDIICDIILSCPSIETLVLSECKCLVESQSPQMLALNHSLINLYEFRMLKCLFLNKVKISDLFFSDFSARFPFLKDLTVEHCSGYEEIQISSPTLERVYIVHKMRILKAKFDVPRLRKFRFAGSMVPSLSFERASSECKFRISISWRSFRTSWLLKLKKFLEDLGYTVHSLSLLIGHTLSESFDFPQDCGLPKPLPVVEKLMLGVYSASSSLLEAMFMCFHPNLIFQFWMPKSSLGDTDDNHFLELLCKTLIQQEGSGNCCIPNRTTPALRDLRRVSLDIYEESLGEFRPLPWKMLLDPSATPERQRVIFFYLQWGIAPSAIK